MTRKQARTFALFLRYVAMRAARDGLTRMAASLSYTSLLSLVPLLAIALAMLAAFPAFDQPREALMSLLFANLVPEVGDVIKTKVDGFVANVDRLTAAGIVGLAASALLMLVTVEGVMNQTFRVTRPRPWASRLLVYWTMLTLGPLMLGAAFSLQGYAALMQGWGMTDALGPLLSLPWPTLLTALAFAALYALMPNRRVAWADALAGGILAALLFAGLRWAYAHYLSQSQSYSTLYGALAVVPIFLFWMFLSWAVILAGAQVTAALPEWRAGHRRQTRAGDCDHRLALALSVLHALIKDCQTNGRGLGRRDLLARTHAAEADLVPILELLDKAGLIAQTKTRRYLPGQSPDQVRLFQVIAALDLEPGLPPSLKAPWAAPVNDILTDLVRIQRQTADQRIKDVLAGPQP